MRVVSPALASDHAILVGDCTRTHEQLQHYVYTLNVPHVCKDFENLYFLVLCHTCTQPWSILWKAIVCNNWKLWSLFY